MFMIIGFDMERGVSHSVTNLLFGYAVTEPVGAHFEHVRSLWSGWARVVKVNISAP
jgi:hypothetical protein